MLGETTPQRDLFSTENSYRDKIKENSFYRFLGDRRTEVFRDQDYAALYCANNGRSSVPPSVLATACVLQSYDRLSDAETVARATFDVRWAVALGTELGEQPFAKSTLQEFRAKLLLHEQVLVIFQRSLTYARQKGYLKNKRMRVAMDTTHILGKGAVKDTYNLLADGIKKLYRTLEQSRPATLIEKFKATFSRYFGKSFKGEAHIDWDDKTARQNLLTSLAAEARSLLELARETIAAENAEENQVKNIRASAELLNALLLQDLEMTPAGQAQIKKGVAPDRIISTTDPESRHGRKSASHRFDGHKAAVATDTESQLITAVAVIAGNAQDGECAKTLVEATQTNTGNEVETAIGDCAFGTTGVREEFENSPTTLVAKAPKAPQSTHFTKHDFTIDLDNNCVTCPAGHTTTTYREISLRFGSKDEKRMTKRFSFSAEVCAGCPMRAQCIKSKSAEGRMIQLHPREDLLRAARATAKTEEFKEQYRARVVVEHSIARLVQRGIRQSRYRGRERTLWQVAMAAAVVNLMIIAAQESAREAENDPNSILFFHFCLLLAAIFLQLLAASLPRIHRTNKWWQSVL